LADLRHKQLILISPNSTHPKEASTSRLALPSLDGIKAGVDVMLLKASGDTHAHKLRTILLMEADFNMNIKKLSREGMWKAETNNCIAPEQAGGRRCHWANKTSLNPTLVCDHSRFCCKAMAICSNDAKGCFDRIVHLVAYICLQRFSIPAAPILSMLNVIQNMTHSIRTAFGDSSVT
jgi:hypothetical protein